MRFSGGAADATKTGTTAHKPSKSDGTDHARPDLKALASIFSANPYASRHGITGTSDLDDKITFLLIHA